MNYDNKQPGDIDCSKRNAYFPVILKSLRKQITEHLQTLNREWGG